MTINITDKNLPQLIQDNNIVVIDFWAEWCGPCKTIVPIIDELAEEYAGKIAIGKINVENNDCANIVDKYEICSVPTLLFFRNGQIVDRHIGATTKVFIKEKIEKQYFEIQVGFCFNDMINGNVTDEYLIETYGQKVFDVASAKEGEYINSLN
jgi:thioredoxin 1